MSPTAEGVADARRPVGDEPRPEPPQSALSRLGALARHAWRWEVGVWVSIWRFVARRPRVPQGAHAFTYHEPIKLILIVFIVLSAVEIPIFDLVLHRWPVVRFTVLAAGVWGLMWMLGLLLGFVTRPHSVGPEGVALHDGPQIRVELSWEDVYSIAVVKDVAETPPKPPRVTSDDRGNVLHLRVQHETNLEIVLERPLSLSVSDTPVTVVRFWADEPLAVLAAARPFLEGTEIAAPRHPLPPLG